MRVGKNVLLKLSKLLQYDQDESFTDVNLTAPKTRDQIGRELDSAYQLATR